MKKLLRKRLLGIPIMVIVTMLLTTGIAVAVYLVTIPSTVTVIP